MEEISGYRRKLARVYMRLFRPLAPQGPRRSKFDQMAARWWTRIDVIAFRHLGVSLGVKALGVNDVLLLRTRGRYSGQVREVLVAYVEIDEVPFICAANGGSDRAPAWYGNLRRGESVEIERKGRREELVPVVLEGEERDRIFEVVRSTFPHVRLYLAHTNRSFPVVRLESPSAHHDDSAAKPAPVMVGASRGSSGSQRIA
ncbi:MAG TPA: nitroreductase/quinone reductase family protein [Acidimicrobiales bacterium]|nr:nitroreductase/quinone reductase family protein [Acidimicrobiales bacterium]